ncbi:MAG: polysaccharide export protein [Opitutus sp.]|nr:polysaccharide export protein [Opitutus sp.]MCS6246426.1 polysaccharide export protein [Opitutus sp.]MCS6273693.1 polysaccharide export protein [Opitutus sp.]MCS6277940.1 polysaccharide export protein [Opitutus sp.]MCS6298953.1 polysaccharide export protein [Opitutus sp.]
MLSNIKITLLAGFSLLIVFPAQAEEPKPSAVPAAALLDYLLQPSDLLDVQIFQEENLKRAVRVSQEYSITLPLIGKVDVKGKSLRQAEDLIRELYARDYLVNPQINVVVIEYAKRSVNVIGQVNQPGAVLFPQEQGLTLLDAVSRAGGFSRLANRTQVKLTRTNADGKSDTYVIDADDLIKGRSSNTWPLLVNDIVFVPERIL